VKCQHGALYQDFSKRSKAIAESFLLKKINKNCTEFRLIQAIIVVAASRTF